MLKKLSAFQMLAAGLFFAGIIPVLVIGLLSGDLALVVIGLVILAAAAAGMAVWLVPRITPAENPFGASVQQIATIADQITASVDAETTAAMTPHIQSLEQVSGEPDVIALAASFERLARVFQQHLDEYNSIYAMGRAITTELDFEQTVQAVLDAVKQVVVFDAAEVSVLRGDRLVVEAWTGQEDFNNTTGRQYRVGRGPTGSIAANKASVLVSTVQGTEEDLKRTLGYESAAGEFLAKTTKVMINSFLGIPLMIEDRVIGTLTLVHREPGRFTESERRQLEKLAAQASIAIDNAIRVRQRESVLKAQIHELRVEIDESRLNKEVEEITGSDYFQRLQAHAAKMRKRVYDRNAKGGSQKSTGAGPVAEKLDTPGESQD
jgi:putative methionine-R-sulfoxide reductase with GAF domain